MNKLMKLRQQRRLEASEQQEANLLKLVSFYLCIRMCVCSLFL